MAQAQRLDFVFQRKGPVHSNRRGCQLSQPLAGEVYTSSSTAGPAVTCLSLFSLAGYPLHSPVSPYLPRPRAGLCHHVSIAVYHYCLLDETFRTKDVTLHVLAHRTSRNPVVRLRTSAWTQLAITSLQMNKSNKIFETAVVCPFKIYPYLSVVAENSALLKHCQECDFCRACRPFRITPLSRNVGIHWRNVTSQKNATPIYAFLLCINIQYLLHVFLPRTLTNSIDHVCIWNMS
jgi:hypothetical protein